MRISSPLAAAQDKLLMYRFIYVSLLIKLVTYQCGVSASFFSLSLSITYGGQFRVTPGKLPKTLCTNAIRKDLNIPVNWDIRKRERRWGWKIFFKKGWKFPKFGKKQTNKWPMSWVFTQSCHRFLHQQCLDGTQCSSPKPALHHLFTVPSDHPLDPPTPVLCSLHLCLSSASWHDDRIPCAGAPEQPQGCRGYYQPPQPGPLSSYIYLPVHVLLLWLWWYGFEELCQIFPSSISREWTCWETDEPVEPVRGLNVHSGYEETRPWQVGE